MSGGTITGNAASNGGGVHISGGTFTMSGGTITDNTASNGGGVYVGDYSGTFIKKGGTIYGDTDAIAGNGNVTDNTATSGNGHAVYAGNKRRNITADTQVNLYASYVSGAWTYDGTGVEGIYEDTSMNWETVE
jgi:hypothetical protein